MIVGISGYARTLPPRVAAKIERGDGCWIWTGARHELGYGRVWDGGKVVPAHRLVYECLVGPIPDGLVIDHLCRVPSCVNPDHLEPVSTMENIRRGNAALPRKACRNGHAYDETNTYVYPSGKRMCRICNRERKRRWRRKVMGVRA